MSAVLLAVFNEHAVAARVRGALLKDGFPSDRVELTSAQGLGQAEAEPQSRRARFERYFSTLLRTESERSLIRSLAARIDQGGAAVAVRPRGSVEAARAAEILEHAGAVEVLSPLGPYRQAAAGSEGYWVRELPPGSLDGS
jgi:hypothetical protein